MSARPIIHYPRVARAIAEQTPMDYMPGALELVEAIMGTHGASLRMPAFRLWTEREACYFQEDCGALYVVDTSESCPSCGGSAMVPAGHPDACHHVNQEAGL